VINVCFHGLTMPSTRVLPGAGKSFLTNRSFNFRFVNLEQSRHFACFIAIWTRRMRYQLSSYRALPREIFTSLDTGKAWLLQRQCRKAGAGSDHDLDALQRVRAVSWQWCGNGSLVSATRRGSGSGAPGGQSNTSQSRAWPTWPPT
jgi:hypothetical protein